MTSVTPTLSPTQAEPLAALVDCEPTGICACGCGRKTAVPTKNDRAKNRFKGVPVQYCQGHHRRVLPTISYKATLVGKKLKRIHRLRAEAAFGKPLPTGAVVHHADGSRDAYAQLVICQDAAYHLLLHARMRVRAAGGDPNTDRVCRVCRGVKNLNDFYRSAGSTLGRRYVCKSCDDRLRGERKKVQL